MTLRKVALLTLLGLGAAAYVAGQDASARGMIDKDDNERDPNDSDESQGHQRQTESRKA